jgi:anti-anti-sigma factor
VAVVELLGEHDLDGREELFELLYRLIDANELVVVDVTETQFIDSSVVFNLVRADRLAREQGSSFRLQVGTAPEVKKMLEITHLLDALAWAPTRDEALAGHVEPEVA